MWCVRDVLYAVLYVRVSCIVVRGCGVSRRYIDVCYCDMFCVVNVYLDHLKFCVVCINSRRYVCCSEWDVVSNECNEPISCLVQSIGAHCCEVMYFRYFGFRGEFGFLNCDVCIVVLVIWSFICCRADEVGSLDLRLSRGLILSNISAGTGSVLIRCRPEGICRDAAFRMMVSFLLLAV